MPSTLQTGRLRVPLMMVAAIAFLLCVLVALPAQALAAPYLISGNVMNARTYNPVVGVPVKLFKVTNGVSAFVTSTPSGANGDYQFGVGAGDYKVGIDAGSKDEKGEDYLATYYDGWSRLADADIITLPDTENWDGDNDPTTYSNADLAISPVGPSISGVVKGSDFVPQLPVAGADMGLFQYGTDPDTGVAGWFVTDWATTSNTGLYQFWSEPSGHYRVGYLDEGPAAWGVRWKSKFWPSASTVESATTIDFTAGAGMHLPNKNLVLDKARKVLTGTVYTRDATGTVDGVAPECAVTLLGGASSDPYAMTLSQDDGTFALYDSDISQGTAVATDSVLQFGGWFYSTTYWNDKGSFATADHCTVGPMSAPSTKNGFVSALPPSIDGTVTASDTSSAAAGVTVLVYSSDATNTASWLDVTRTGADGTYALWESPGDYKVFFYTGAERDTNLTQVVDFFNPTADHQSQWWDAQSSGPSAADTITTQEGVTFHANAVLNPNPTPAITGIARDATGTPVAGVAPMAFKYDASNPAAVGWYVAGWAGQETTASGTYAIWGLDPGTYHVGHGAGGGFFEPNGIAYVPSFYDGKSDVASADGVVWDGSTTASSIDLTYTVLQPLITGRVLTTRGAPIEDAMVAALVYEPSPFDPAYSDWVPDGPLASTDASGNYAIYSDTDGPYKIEFDAFGYIGQLYNHIPLDNADGESNTSIATTVTTTIGTTVTGVNANLAPEPQTADRIDGMALGSSSRYTVAADIAAQATDSYGHTTDVILACGEDRAMADPLASAGLSWAYDNAPLLLTPSGSGKAANYARPVVPAFVLNAIKTAVYNVRLSHSGPGITLHVVGGKGSVPDARIAEIRNYVKVKLGLSSAEAAKALVVTRVNGSTRYENARIIAALMKARRGSEMPKVALVVNGSDPTKFFDAMAAAPIAASSGVPMILVQTNAVPQPAASTVSLLGLSGSQLVVVGPKTDVTASVASQLHATARIAGTTADSYATAKAVTGWGIGRGYLGNEAVGIASKLPDALGAGPALGAKGAGMLFTYPGSAKVPAPTLGFLSANKATLTDVTIFGGTGSITALAQKAINNALKP